MMWTREEVSFAGFAAVQGELGGSEGGFGAFEDGGCAVGCACGIGMAFCCVHFAFVRIFGLLRPLLLLSLFNVLCAIR